MGGVAAAANEWEDGASSYAAHLHLISGEAVDGDAAASAGTVVPLDVARVNPAPVGDGIIYAW